VRAKGLNGRERGEGRGRDGGGGGSPVVGGWVAATTR